MKKPLKPLSKEDKIKLLLDLNSGKLSISDLHPKSYKIWRLMSGLYHDYDGNSYTEEGFEAIKQAPGVINIIVSRVKHRTDYNEAA